MKRFYLKQVGTNVSVVNRNTHELIGFISIEDKLEAKKIILDLAKMSTEDYIKYALENRARFREETKNTFLVDDENERWYKGAWIYTTRTVLKELGIKEEAIPEENITVELVNAVKESIRISNKKANELPIQELKDSKEEVSATVEPKKPLPKKIEKKQEKKPLPKKETAYTKDILRDLLASGKIDAKKYREELAKIRNTKKPLKVIK